MSGVELVEIISDTITIVDASLKNCEAVEDTARLPRCFLNVAARLPVVRDSLETVRAVSTEEYEENKGELPKVQSHDALVEILESCFDKAANLASMQDLCCDMHPGQQQHTCTGIPPAMPDRLQHCPHICTPAPIQEALGSRHLKNAPVGTSIPEMLHYRISDSSWPVGINNRPEWPLKLERDGYHSPSPNLRVQTNDAFVTKPFDRRGFEIAIICALPLEYDAVSLVFDEFWDEEGDIYRRAAGDENTYTTGRIGKFNTVLVLLSSVGKISAANAAASVRWSYPCLRLTLLVGICGGVPRAQNGEEILLGDVIISNTIVQYDFGWQYPNEFVHKRMSKDDMSPPNNDIRNLLTSFSTRHRRTQLQRRTATFLRQLQLKAAEVSQDGIYNYPGSNHDQLFVPTHRHKHHNPPQCICHHCNTKADAVCGSVLNAPCSILGCVEGHNRDQLIMRKRLESKRRLEESNDEKAQEPSLYVGAIASGDTVMQSGEHRDQIAMREDVIAFEMEGAGVWGVIPCIVVKGVSDYADSHKNNMWQNFAAATAAAALKAILERYIQPDKSV